MNEEEDLCICFHVSRRKVAQFIRVQKPQRVSQLSECYGAGTGCGWCRPYLKQMMAEQNPDEVALPDCQAYADGREEYRQTKSDPLDR